VRRLSPARIGLLLAGTTLLGLMFPATAAAQSCGTAAGRFTLRLDPGLVTFPDPGPDDFAIGWVEAAPLLINVRPRGTVNRPWVLCLRADTPDMGGYGKPISDLQFRRDGQSAWTAMRLSDQLLAQGDRGEDITLHFRVMIDESVDAPGLYRADYTATAARP
jgi:hypothetical protein